MGFLAELEQRIEGTIQRLFPKKRGEGLQPLHIARLLSRAMESRRRVSVDVVYVPNRFEIAVNPDDHAELQPVARTVERDVVRHLERIARSRGFGFTGPIELHFVADPAQPAGTLKVETTFREALREEGRKEIDPFTVRGRPATDQGAVEKGEGEELTRRFKAILPDPPPESARVVVLTGPMEGASFPLTKERPFVIGRSPDADLRLADSKVSRRHAILLWEEEAWWLADQGSTNGTLLNGEPVSRAALADGDQLVVGLTMLRFRQG